MGTVLSSGFVLGARVVGSGCVVLWGVLGGVKRVPDAESADLGVLRSCAISSLECRRLDRSVGGYSAESNVYLTLMSEDVGAIGHVRSLPWSPTRVICLTVICLGSSAESSVYLTPSLRISAS